MRMRTQRILAALLSLVLLLALAPAGWAEGGAGGTGETMATESVPATGVNLDLGANTVNINLVPKDKEGTEFEKDIVNAKIQADLYLVAPAVKDDKYDTYHYEFVDYAPIRMIHGKEFEDNLADDPDPAKQNKQETMLEKFTPLAYKFAEAILSEDNIIVPKSSEPTKSTTITVSELDPGLYMLILRGSDLKVKAEDEDECYVTKMTKKSGEGTAETEIIATRAFSDSYEFLFEPQMITVPTKVDKETGTVQQYNTAYGVWTNTLNIVAKPDYKPRNGDLKIVKALQGYIGTDPATFVYSVKATTGEGEKQKVVFSDVVAVNYPNETEVVIEKQIPVGAKVTVEEVYQGSRYEIVGEITQETTILSPIDENAPASVTFTNKHDNTDTGGYGVVNNFTYFVNKEDPTKNAWKYEKQDPMHPVTSGTSD